ncbi:hypothetical protein VXQ35_15145 [Acinetobacter oleivorans]|uniref:hypothetical protein n=1 Tax=Acinetobacter oleivorans TaxID=1148157 RepID=UPI003A83928E
MSQAFIDNHHHHFYKAACSNVKETGKNYSILNKSINSLITKHPLIHGQLTTSCQKEIKLLTKLAILAYTAHTEALFLKLIYTHNGFTKDEINQILKTQKKENIIMAWKKAFEISARKSIGKKSNFFPNSIKKINNIIDTHLKEPSELRNKIAHGQWVVAFNSKNSEINGDLTLKIEKISIVDINKWLRVFKTLSELISLAIQSPLKGYPQQFWEKITQIEENLNKISTWSLEEKIKKMHAKKSRSRLDNN